jgi:hypothetical protein
MQMCAKGYAEVMFVFIDESAGADRKINSDHRDNQGECYAGRNFEHAPHRSEANMACRE